MFRGCKLEAEIRWNTAWGKKPNRKMMQWSVLNIVKSKINYGIKKKIVLSHMRTACVLSGVFLLISLRCWWTQWVCK